MWCSLYTVWLQYFDTLAHKTVCECRRVQLSAEWQCVPNPVMFMDSQASVMLTTVGLGVQEHRLNKFKITCRYHHIH